MKDIKKKIRQLEKLRTVPAKKALIPLLEQYLKDNAGDICAWYRLACCNDFLGRELKAEPCYAKVYKGWHALPGKERPGFFVGYGSTLRNNKKLAQAAKVLREGVKHFPSNPELRIFLALALYSAGDFKSSARELFRACGGLPPSCVNGYDRAIAYYVKTLK
ncbi:MAG: hypothetical protein A2089_08955 [Elusimicrobia bacterium GWD2_63_28]|nr:MAG: hypothetical protein A2089_08955 [Elusimicrobia bacterium GWD2_63_28]